MIMYNINHWSWSQYTTSMIRALSLYYFSHKGTCIWIKVRYVTNRSLKRRGFGVLVFDCLVLKTLDTIGNCRRPVFSLGVSQHMYKITNLWKFELNWSSKLRDIKARKNTLVAPWSHEFVCFQMVDFGTSNSKSEVLKWTSWKITSFTKTICHFRGSQPLPINLHQVMFYTNKYFK